MNPVRHMLLIRSTAIVTDPPPPSVTTLARHLLTNHAKTIWFLTGNTCGVRACDVSLIKHTAEIPATQKVHNVPAVFVNVMPFPLKVSVLYKPETSDVLSSTPLPTKAFYLTKTLKVLLD